MRRILAVAAMVSILALSGTVPAQAGKIVVTNDEWTLSDYGFSVNAMNAAKFAENVAQWFAGGSGNFLVYSGNSYITGTSLQTVMTNAGYGWTISLFANPTITDLMAYKGVFLAGSGIDNQLLIDYVNGGGNVFLEGGTGEGGSVNEAARWNTFLNAFGLGFGDSYNGIGGNIGVSSTHPIFAGVTSLYQNNGNDTLDIDLLDPRAQVLVSSNGHGLYAVYESVSVPEPGTILLLGGALLGLFGLRRKVRA